MTQKEKGIDLLKWVGGRYWSRDSFFKESLQLGTCLRIGRVPNVVEINKSKVLLVSDFTEAEREKWLKEKKRRSKERRVGRKNEKKVSFKGVANPRGTAHIFAYFIIRGIAYVVGPKVNLPKELEKRGIKAYQYSDTAFGFQKERECGSLKIGGTYLLSEEDLEKCKDLVSDELVDGQIVPVDPTVPYTGKRFRGFKIVNAEKLLV